MNQSSGSSHSKESAGGVMIGKDFVPVVPLGTTLAHIRDLLSKKGRDYESVNYIYVVDGQARLRGIVSIREFFIHQHDKERVDDIIEKNLITIRPHTHQERAALLALQHGLTSIPVVDKDDVFLGVIPAHILLKILDKEAIEDILRLRGMYFSGPYDDLLKMSVFESVKHRLPWLLFGLFGGLVAAFIVGMFQETLSQNLILASFIPLIAYMAGAVGTQMEIFIIRDFALHPMFSFLKYFFKQFFVIGLIGIMVSAVAGVITFFLYTDARVSIVLSISLFFAMLFSVLTGLIIPYIFRKLALDPANGSGPVATIIQDILSVLVYFLIASFIL